MSGKLIAFLADIVEAHNVSMCGNLGVPGMHAPLELKCPTCGPVPGDGRQVFKQHASHVAAAVIETLGLTREEHWIPVDETGARYHPRCLSHAEETLRNNTAELCHPIDLPAVTHIECETRFVTEWVKA